MTNIDQSIILSLIESCGSIGGLR